MSYRRRAWLAAVCITALTAAAGSVRAETLAEAIALAYQSNPTLQMQRAQQRALDETFVQARAGWRPTADVALTDSYSKLGAGHGRIESNTDGVALEGTQPLYTGGRTDAAVRAAEGDILAGREGLRALEAQIIQQVVQAYEDVRRDAQIVGIRENNVTLLESQREETGAKFQVGQVTRTDTAQAEAQLAAGRALLAEAQGQLQISRANYAAVVGQNPGTLAPEPPLPGLPATAGEAYTIAESTNANLLRAQLAERASRARIAEAKAAGNATVSIGGSIGYSQTVQPFYPGGYQREIGAQATIRQPLFSGGVVRSQVRAAIEQNNSDRIGIEAARRTVVQGVSQAWNTMVAAHASVLSNDEQVRAARVAFEGMQEQYRVALSTTLDVLISEQTLQNAELSLVSARHDEYVAQAALLAAMGRLEAGALLQGAPLYNPAASFQRVKNDGAVPWESAVKALDELGAPRPGPPAAIPVPPSPTGPVTMVPAGTAAPTGQPLSTVTPTAPNPASPASH